MRWSFVLIVTVIITAVLLKHLNLIDRSLPFPKMTSDPIPVVIRPAELMSATDFTFTFGAGSGWHGYNVVKVRADGTCQYTFLDVRSPGGKHQWRRAEFSLDGQTDSDLRQLLTQIDFFALKRSYHGDVVDGTQWFMNVSATGKTKRVYCDNYVPSKVEPILQFVEKRIFEKHRLVIDKAEIIQLERKDMESDVP
jgi:hypothetical protein